MKKLAFTLGLGILALGLTGCAPLVCQVQVNGYTNPNIPAPLSPGASFFVIDNKEAKNPLLEAEIKRKIINLLEKQGYPITPFEKADYYLLFSYGIGVGRGVTVLIPDYYPGTFGFYPGYYPGRYYPFVWPGLLSYAPYAETIYDKWLLINVIQGKVYRDQGAFQTVWIGEARGAGPSQDLRTVVNFLLLADFKQFGINTGKAVLVDINKDDIRLKELEQVR